MTSTHHFMQKKSRRIIFAALAGINYKLGKEQGLPHQFIAISSESINSFGKNT